MGEKEKSPAFQFYPNDFLSSSRVDQMSMTERGVYITLLSRCWQDNGLPTDLASLSGLVRMKLSQFRRMWDGGQLRHCFEERDGKLINPRLEEEREKQQRFRRRQSDNANKRHGSATVQPVAQPPQEPGSAMAQPPHSQAPARALKTEEEDEDLLVVASSKEGGVGETVPRYDVWLRQLQESYPNNRVTSGHSTMTAFVDVFLEHEAHRRPADVWAEMRENLAINVRSHEWRVKGMVPRLEKYLRDGGWKQRHPEGPPVAEQLTPKVSRTLQAAAEARRMA